MLSFIKNSFDNLSNFLFDKKYIYEILEILEISENDEFSIVIGRHKMDKIYFDLITTVKITRYFIYNEI